MPVKNIWNIYQIINSVFYVIIKLCYKLQNTFDKARIKNEKNPPTFWALYVHCNIQMYTANVRIFVGNEFLWSNCLNFLNDCTRLFTCKASTFFNRFSDSRLFSSVIPLFSIMKIYLSLLNNLITISFGHLNKHLSRKCHFL